MQGGATVEQVIAAVVGSAEFYQAAGGTNAGFVNAVYGYVLNRAADAGGAGYWTGALNGGAPRSSVAAAILASQEYRIGLVASYYAQYLRRAADQGGLYAWVKSPQSDQSVLAGILGSGEGVAAWS